MWVSLWKLRILSACKKIDLAARNDLAKLNSRISVEVLTLPAAAEPTLRAAVHVPLAVTTRRTALKNDFVLQARGLRWTFGPMSLIGNRKQTC